jgi:CDP-diacylglycerol---serine O-phosphatidyltransferase
MNAAEADEGSRPRRRLFRRRRRSDRPPFNLRKALFILPNAFTISSIFCGFYAILKATSDGGPHAFYQAGVALIFAAFFDAFDGRVARMTRTQSDFGVQIDSLADVISFGVAPGLLVYSWALEPLGLPGLVAAFAFTACGAIRLARFNVLAARGLGSSKYFLGLPIPGAASMVVSLVIAQSWSFSIVVDGQREWADGGAVTARWGVLAVVVVLSYLMVSRVRFRTFKDFRPSVRTTPVLAAVILALIVAMVMLKASMTLVCAVSAYILLGLVEEVVFFRKRRASDAAEKATLLAEQARAAQQAPSITS